MQAAGIPNSPRNRGVPQPGAVRERKGFLNSRNVITPSVRLDTPQAGQAAGSPAWKSNVQHLATPSTPQTPMDHLLDARSLQPTSQSTEKSRPPFQSLQAKQAISILPSTHPGQALSESHEIQALPVVRQEQCWVTVFGFPREEMERVMLEFRRIGEVTQQMVAGDNFVHLQYTSEDLAKRALDKNHKEILSARGTPFMIGVKSYLPQEAARDQEIILPTAQVSYGQQLRMPSELDAQRSYRIMNDPDIAIQKSSSLWTKMGNLVFGA